MNLKPLSIPKHISITEQSFLSRITNGILRNGTIHNFHTHVRPHPASFATDPSRVYKRTSTELEVVKTANYNSKSTCKTIKKPEQNHTQLQNARPTQQTPTNAQHQPHRPPKLRQANPHRKQNITRARRDSLQMPRISRSPRRRHTRQQPNPLIHGTDPTKRT